MEFVDPSDFGLPYNLVIEDENELSRLLTVLKRGSNTQSPPDLEIINLIREMEK